MGFLDDLSLLGRHAPEDARNLLKTIIGRMPITQIVQGEAEVSPNKLKEILLGMPKFDANDQTGVQEGMNWMQPMMAAKIVYHGSPHKFDKFDASKIGTGEGAQAYGHGVYLAEAPEVAKGYRDTLALPEVQMGGATFEPKDNIYKLATHAQQNGLKTQDEVVSFWKDRVNESKAALRAQQSGTADWRQNSSAEMLARRNEMLALAKKTDPSQISINEGGALYKADLPDEWIPKMLDWDKPLKEQGAEIKALADKIGTAHDLPGRALYNQAQLKLDIGDGPLSPGVAAKLRELGIPGIRYLDGGSRPKNVVDARLQSFLEKHKGDTVAAVDDFMRGVYESPKVKEKMRAQFLEDLKQPTYNYVVFPGLEDKVKILERNGQPVNALAEMLK